MNPADVSLTLDVLALIGAGAYVIGQWGWREATPVSIRLASLLTLLMALVAMRITRRLLDFPFTVRIEEGVAAFIPLFALVLAEGMMRRHAPGLLKLLMVIGSIAVAAGALLRTNEMQANFASVLGGYLIFGLLAVSLLLASRRRGSLSPGENIAISAFFGGLLFALPLGATDFLAMAKLIPIGVGGLALIVFLFFASHVTSEGSGGLSALGELFWALIAASVTYAALGFVRGWPEGVAQVQTAAIIIALLLVFRIVLHVREQRKARARQTLWRAYASAPSDSLEAFLNTVLSADEFKRAQLLEGRALADYDHDRLRRAFAADPVISARDIRRARAPEFEQLDVIFDQHQATHAVIVRAHPLAMLLVNRPRVGAGTEVDVQLAVLARLAKQIPPSAEARA
jgi:hypothetical protein